MTAKNKYAYERVSVWKNGDAEKIMEYADGYKAFLGENKTEREFSTSAVEFAKKKGFTDLSEAVKAHKKIKCGDKFYLHYMNKCAVFFVIGKEPLENGMNITAAHIDSPRLDLKGMPLYEDGDIALMKTHYYGGIKKYQWPSVPLAMHGVIYTAEGEKITLSLGEKEDEPVFFISDLLVHLSAEQLAKTASSVVTAEQLNIIVGNIPFADEDDDIKEKFKYNVLKILNDKYGITEEDFISAEIEFVPAAKPRDVGFDASMIAAYGHDDKVCAYPAFTAITEMTEPQRTCACILADKEEIGSVGSTGMQAKYFENAVAELCAMQNDGCSDLYLRRAMASSYVLSMDVCCLYDPSFADAFEKQNTAKMGSGTILTKYTGSRGKSGSNDAHSEYMYKLRRLFEENGVAFQTGELGRTDLGGGGTVAYILAAYGAMTVDLGVGVLDMHSTCELISKADLYSTYSAAAAFYAVEK